MCNSYGFMVYLGNGFFSEAHRDMNSSRNKRPQRVGFFVCLICTKELMKPTVKIHMYGMICKRSCHNRIALTDYKNTRGKKSGALYRPNTNNARERARTLNKHKKKQHIGWNDRDYWMHMHRYGVCVHWLFENAFCFKTVQSTSPIALIDLCSNAKQQKKRNMHDFVRIINRHNLKELSGKSTMTGKKAHKSANS